MKIVNHREVLQEVSQIVGVTNVSLIGVSEAIVAKSNQGVLRISTGIYDGIFTAPVLMNCGLLVPEMYGSGRVEIWGIVYDWELWEFIEGVPGSHDDVMFALKELQTATGVEKKFIPIFRKQTLEFSHLDVDAEKLKKFAGEMDELWGQMSSTHQAIVHADMHELNLIKNTMGVWVIDSGAMGVGPRAWDASYPIVLNRFGLAKDNKGKALEELTAVTHIPGEEIVAAEKLVAWNNAIRASLTAKKFPEFVLNASSRIHSLLYPDQSHPIWMPLSKR